MNKEIQEKSCSKQRQRRKKHAPGHDVLQALTHHDTDIEQRWRSTAYAKEAGNTKKVRRTNVVHTAIEDRTNWPNELSLTAGTVTASISDTSANSPTARPSTRTWTRRRSFTSMSLR